MDGVQSEHRLITWRSPGIGPWTAIIIIFVNDLPRAVSRSTVDIYPMILR